MTIMRTADENQGYYRRRFVRATARGSFGEQESLVRVVWDRHSVPRYHLSFDDNSFSIRDISQHDIALRWVTERGYKPVFFHEGLLGGAE